MRRESSVADTAEEPESIPIPEVIFPAGNSDFRAVRNSCAQACRIFNNTPEDADPEERSQKWLDIVRPDRNRNEDGIAVTHDQTFANPALKAKTPFVKPPVYIDYGIRLHVGGSTFINRGCMIMDTPVADVVIGEGCNIGPNCCIVGVTHPVRLDERLLRHSIGQPVTIGNDVWIGTNVTILGGVTIGDGAVIGACSLVNRDIPPMTVAYGAPARVVAHLKDVKPTMFGATVKTGTLGEAMALPNRLPMRGWVDGGDDDGDEESGGEEDKDGAEVEEEEEEDHGEGYVGPDVRFGSGLGFGLGRVGLSRRSRECSVGSRSSATVLSEEQRLGELRGLLSGREGRRQERRLKWLEVKVFVAGAAAAVLFILFFLAGVYLGANKSSWVR